MDAKAAKDKKEKKEKEPKVKEGKEPKPKEEKGGKKKEKEAKTKEGKEPKPKEEGKKGTKKEAKLPEEVKEVAKEAAKEKGKEAAREEQAQQKGGKGQNPEKGKKEKKDKKDKKDSKEDKDNKEKKDKKDKEKKEKEKDKNDQVDSAKRRKLSGEAPLDEDMLGPEADDEEDEFWDGAIGSSGAGSSGLQAEDTGTAGGAEAANAATSGPEPQKAKDTAPEEPAGASFQAGQAVEAKYGDSFFDAEVLEVSGEKIHVKYAYDASEAELWLSDVRLKGDIAPAVQADVPDSAVVADVEKDAVPSAEPVSADGGASSSTTAPTGFSPGAAVQAKFGNSFFDAEVIQNSGDTVKVRYLYDGSEASLTKEEVLPKAESHGAGAVAGFRVGEMVEAKFGNSFFEAEVVEVGSGEKVTIKYKYDGSTAELPISEVRSTGNDAAPVPTEEKWEDALEVDVGWEIAAKLREDEAWKAMIEKLSGTQVNALESGTVRCKAGEGARIAEFLLRMMSKREADASDDPPPGLPTTVVAVPPEERKATLQAKLGKVTDEHHCIALFVAKVVVAAASENEGAAEALEPGQKVEAKFGNSFFDAEVLEVTESGAKVRYAYDGSEAELPRGDIKLKAAGQANAGTEEPPPLEPGQAVEAKFGNSFFVAEVVEVNGDTVKVRYDYDKSEAELPRAEVKPKPAGEAKAETAEPAQPTPQLEPGAAVEAKFGNSFFKAEVVEVNGDLVKVRYDYDKSEAELPSTDVKTPAAAPDGGADSAKLQVGAPVEAKFGNSFFEAEVVEVGSGVVKVKYKYDGSEAELPLADVKEKEAPKPYVTEPLRIFGEGRSRAMVAFEAYRIIVARDGLVNAEVYLAGVESDPLDTDGISFVELTMPGRVIGAKGSVKQKIERATSARIEIIGEKLTGKQFALVGGTAQERSVCLPILHLVQTMGQGPNNLPEAMLASATRVLIPQQGVKVAMGKGRATMNQIEDELGVISFNAATVVPIPEGQESETDLEPGLPVEAKFGNSFFAAEVVEIDGDTVTVKYEYDGSEAALPSSEVRRKVSGEALAARERANRLANFHTLAIIGPEWARRSAEVKVMSVVEAECAGTYLPSDENSSHGEVPLGADMMQAVKEERKRQDEERKWAEEKRWAEQKWHEDKWESKWEESQSQNQAQSANRWEEKKWEETKWEQPKAWEEEKKWEAPSDQGASAESWDSAAKRQRTGEATDWRAQPQQQTQQQPQQQPQQQQQQQPQQQPQQQLPPQQAPGVYPGVAAIPSYQPVVQEHRTPPPVRPCDPRQRLQQFGSPTTIEEWTASQERIWEGHRPLPPGWIRVWSRSQDREYYVRIVDCFSVFDLNEVLASEQYAAA